MLGTLLQFLFVDNLHWMRVCLVYLIQLYCLVSKEKIIINNKKKNEQQRFIQFCFFILLFSIDRRNNMLFTVDGSRVDRR